MRVFVYEHACAGGAAASNLRIEGWAMLSALLADFARIPGVEVATVLNECPENANRDLLRSLDAIAHTGDAFTTFARRCDFTLVVAPEWDGILERLSREVEQAGGRLLGSTPDAVRLTGDKFALGRHLSAVGVPTPVVCEYADAASVPDDWWPVVCKPRHGAGARATFLVRNSEELAAAVATGRAEGWLTEFILQPFVIGQAASVALLVGPDRQVPLVPATQHLSDDERLHYQGGDIPLRDPLAGRAVSLAGEAVAHVPGLRGYVGVDLVLGQAGSGRDDQVIEINPRLTTSYVGLRALARCNLADVMLRVATGEQVPPIEWDAGGVRYWPDGSVQRRDVP